MTKRERDRGRKGRREKKRETTTTQASKDKARTHTHTHTQWDDIVKLSSLVHFVRVNAMAADGHKTESLFTIKSVTHRGD